MHSVSFPWTTNKSEEVFTYPWMSFVPYSPRRFWETVFHKLIYGSNCTFPLLVNVIYRLGKAGGAFCTQVFVKSKGLSQQRKKNILQKYKEWYIDATEVEKLVELKWQVAHCSVCHKYEIFVIKCKNWRIWSMKKFVHKHCTVLCKRNESEVHRISSFVLTKVQRNFATEFLTNSTTICPQHGQPS